MTNSHTHNYLYLMTCTETCRFVQQSECPDMLTVVLLTCLDTHLTRLKDLGVAWRQAEVTDLISVICVILASKEQNNNACMHYMVFVIDM